MGDESEELYGDQLVPTTKGDDIEEMYDDKLVTTKGDDSDDSDDDQDTMNSSNQTSGITTKGDHDQTPLIPTSQYDNNNTSHKGDDALYEKPNKRSPGGTQKETDDGIVDI